jgi:hypothetical protein
MRAQYLPFGHNRRFLVQRLFHACSKYSSMRTHI